jgi:hypothetical protein
MERYVKFIVLVLLAAAVYYLLSHHLIFIDSWKPRTLNKIHLTFEDTFVGASKLRSAESLLSNKALRDAGLGELLVSLGRMTEDQLAEIKAKYEK